MPDLIEDGYCLLRNALPPALIQRLRQVTDTLSRDADPNERPSQGIMLSAMADPLLGELIAHRNTLGCLQTLGYPNPTFTDGYIISKPVHSPKLFWHYDWFAWEDTAALSREPQQVFLMAYLVDTNRENGCLRVIPGSHRQHNVLHDQLQNPHSAALSQITNPDDAAFSTRPDEVDVPVCAGDLVVGDARLLHAAHANATDQLRTVITLWYQPAFHRLPERVKAQMVRKTHQVPDNWPESVRQAVEALHPNYDGEAEPYGRSLYRSVPSSGDRG